MAQGAGDEPAALRPADAAHLRRFFCRLADPGDGSMNLQAPGDGWLIASASSAGGADRLADRSTTPTGCCCSHSSSTPSDGCKARLGVRRPELQERRIRAGPPRVMLLDCDGAAALSDTGRKQSSTPFWDPPECAPGRPPARHPSEPAGHRHRHLQARPGHPALPEPGEGPPARCRLGRPLRDPRGIDRASWTLRAPSLIPAGAVRATARPGRRPRKCTPTSGHRRPARRAAQDHPGAGGDARRAARPRRPGRMAGSGRRSGHRPARPGCYGEGQMDMRVGGMGCAFRPVTPGPVRIEVTNPYGKRCGRCGPRHPLRGPRRQRQHSVDLPVPPIPAVAAHFPRAGLRGLPARSGHPGPRFRRCRRYRCRALAALSLRARRWAGGPVSRNCNAGVILGGLT